MSTLQRGTAFTIQTVCYDMVTPTDPINVATQISKDGGPFVATTNAPSVTSPGLVTVALTAAEMTCDRFAIKVTSSNLEPHIVPYYTEDSYTGDRAARLDATVSSRAPSGEYDTPMARLDATVSSRSSHSATDVRDTILSDATKFKGADIATIASDVAGLDGAAMRGTDGAALAADWTATRAGHIDKLDVAGTLAHTGNADTFKANVSGLALEATLTAIKGAGWSNETLKAIADAVTAITPGDATAANQSTIITHLTDIKGSGWSDETLKALKVLLAAIPTTDYTSTLSGISTDIDSLNDISKSDVETATGTALDTYSAAKVSDITTAVSPLALEATLTAIKGTGWDGETLKAISTAIGAISPGDATSANQSTILNHLSDIKGATWSNETLVALKSVIDLVLSGQAALAPAGEYDAPMANLDAKVSSRSTLTATDVWSNPGRTLTSFGTLVSDIATAVWSSVVRTITGGKVDTVDGKDLTNLDVPVSTRAVPGDQMDLVTAINSAALNTLNNAITVTLTQQDIEDLVHGIAENLESIDISADSIAQLVASVLNGLAGVGGLAVTIPVVFAEGAVPIPGLYYRVERADGTIVSWWKTDENGHINLLLDGGTYYIWLENNINYNILNPYEYVVEESGTYDPIEVSPVLGIAPPHEPNICTCYMDIRYAAGEQAGELVGEKEAWIDILDVSGRGKKGPLDLSGELPLAALSGQRVYSDSRGRVAFPAIRGVDLRISLTRPWSVNEKQLTNSIQFTVPDETTYAIEFEG